MKTAGSAGRTAGQSLRDLLTEVGRVYVPVLLANAQALEAGERQMQTVMDGQRWMQPAFLYQGKCLGWIREKFAALSQTDAGEVREMLAGTGCEALIEDHQDQVHVTVPVAG